MDVSTGASTGKATCRPTEGKRIAVCGGHHTRGGMEVAMFRTMSLLCQMGCEVVFVTKTNIHVMSDLIPEGVTVVYASADSRLSRFLGTMLRDGERGTWWMRVIRKTMYMLAGERSLLAFAYAGNHLTGLPEGAFDAVLDFEGYGSMNTIIGTRINAPIRASWIHAEKIDIRSTYPYLLRDYDRIFCVSHIAQSSLSRRYPRLAGRSRVLFNPVDADMIRRRSMLDVPSELQNPAPSAFRIVTVSRLSSEKNIELSVRVAAMLRDRGLPFLWEVFGEGSEQAGLQALIDRLGVGGRFVLRGAVSNPYPYVRRADVYVQTSRNEGFGLTVQEARILGVPVIATDIPAFREQIVDGQTGFLRPADATALADAIIRLAKHPEERRRMAENLAKVDWDGQQDMSPLYEFLGL
ncbi:glycosyltransferase [Bifidobacterium simiarum]|uniref:glycosyltransferase n=1 Tax=Bifidobacterium simiarum TaxID=2045441 RepID=UPI001BDD39E7|nr:glycosyltransferase [Bifidobacterium simiarum]MBT1165717.1 glycosyltransferase [Bifidobacterium simiarum]